MNRSTISRALAPLLFLICVCGLSSKEQLRPGNLTVYKEKDGLPGMQVNHILVDRQGYIWTGTINGLARFDGYQFQRYYFNPNDSSTVHGLIVWSLFEDRKGYVWVGSAPSFMNRYDPATRSFRQYPFLHLFPGKSGIEINIDCISQDDKGRLYFGATTYYGDSISHALLYKDEADTALHIFPTDEGNPILNIGRMTRGPDGNIWFLNFTGLFRINALGKLIRFNDKAPGLARDEGATDFAVDEAGHLIELTNKSRLLEFDQDGVLVKSYPIPAAQPDFFSRFLMDKEGNVWIGASNGIFHFDRRTGALSHFLGTDPNAAGHSPIRDLHLDSFGNLWVGTDNDGLLRYEDKNRVRSYVHDGKDVNSLTAAWVGRIMEAADGKIWITTGGGPVTTGINILDPATGMLRAIPYSRIGSRISGVSTLWEPEPGKVWLAVYNGIYEFSPTTLKLVRMHLPGVPDSMVINYRLMDGGGREWLGTGNGVYLRKKGATMFVQFNLLKQPGANYSSNEVSRIVEGPKNGIWFLTNNGLFQYDPTSDKPIRRGYDKALGDIFVTQDVNSLYEDSAGTVWVGTWQGGLSKYDVKSGKIKTYTRNDGLPSNSIQGILPDDKNHSLWLSTFEGMSRMELSTAQFSNYSIDDGIQGLLFSDGAQLRTSKGLLVFGGANGLTIFNPDSVNQKTMPPKVFLSDLKLFNRSVLSGRGSVLTKPIHETDSIELHYDQNNITLEYIGIHYSNPSLNRYAYKLENYDPDWRDVGNQRVAFYPSLPPGHYVFRVKAANDKGVWNEQGATLHITILPPWWRTTWAYLLYAVLLGFLVFALDRYFRARILTRERERTRTKELEQAKEIQKAYVQLGQAHESLKATQTQLVQSEKMASLGELTAGIAHEIQNPLNFVNNFSEVNIELADDLVTAIDKQEYGEAKELADDIKGNQEKIREHGKRADAIVKSMLQHSRASTGQKEPTDLNALADEYLKLAFHGMRAKDKSFNVTLETDFDRNLPKVDVIPQDIGRVLLNLYNNAFQAVMERKKSGGDAYEPKVRVEIRGVGIQHAALSGQESSRQGEQQGANVDPRSSILDPRFITLRVTDNGAGIPEGIQDKIFQPFFTTKPTGQGTGLGLSLSYDIVTKGHSGTLTLEKSSESGSTFTINLPI